MKTKAIENSELVARLLQLEVVTSQLLEHLALPRDAKLQIAWMLEEVAGLNAYKDDAVVVAALQERAGRMRASAQGVRPPTG